MNKTLPIIAVLLTCYNRKQKTLECLSAVYKQRGIDIDFLIEVFLVDDASTDGTTDAVNKQFANVKVIQGTGNLYWNRGMYLAWSTAVKCFEYDYYLWINDDTELINDAFAELLTCDMLAGGESVICGLICSKLTGRHTYGGNDKAGKPVVPSGNLQTLHVMNGNCVLINKLVYNGVGLIDPVFIHAIGDFDYSLRAQKKLFSILSSRKYIGYCEAHDQLPQWCLQEVRVQKRLKVLYSPLGNSHPYYFFIFEKRHYGLLTALKHCFTIHLRVFLPSLWK